MKRNPKLLAGCAIVLMLAIAGSARAHDAGGDEHQAEAWNLNASVIESTSGSPDCAQGNTGIALSSRSSSPDGDRPCQYNRAIKINTGRVGSIALDGVRFWMAGARGMTTALHEQEWSDIVFDPSVTPEQRTATLTVLSHLYPVQWLSFTVVGTPAEVSWEASADRARARLAGGTAGEISLSDVDAATGSVTTAPRYAAAPRSSGAVQMRSGSHAYKRGSTGFRATETPGIVVTFDMSSADSSD